MATLGYCRTSTSDQVAGLEAQQRDLLATGCSIIFSEQVSSVADSRPELTRVLTVLQRGDSLVVCKPDRLARSTLDLLRIVADLDAKGVALIILSMGGQRLDTRNPTSKLMLTILAGVATWEREIMLERQRDGIAKAQANGKYKPVGRARPMPQHIIDSVFRLSRENNSPDQIVAALGISRSTFFRAKKGRESNGIGQFQPPAPACAA